MVGDWQGLLDSAVPEEQVKEFPGHARTGRPLGDEPFVERLEQLLGRRAENRRKAVAQESKRVVTPWSAHDLSSLSFHGDGLFPRERYARSKAARKKSGDRSHALQGTRRRNHANFLTEVGCSGRVRTCFASHVPLFLAFLITSQSVESAGTTLSPGGSDHESPYRRSCRRCVLRRCTRGFVVLPSLNER